MARLNLPTLGRHGAIRVAIVGDRPLIRAGLARLLEQAGDIVVVGEVSEGEAAVGVVAELRPDLALIDLSTQRWDANATTRRLRAAYPKLHVLVLSSRVDRASVLDAVAAGAGGYLLADSSPEELLHGIRAAVSGGSALAPRAARELVTAWRELHKPAKLTDRELDVLVLLAEGQPNKVIAQRLQISEKTVKAHATNVFHALRVTDRTQAALWVERHGLTPRQQQRRKQLLAKAQPSAA